MWKRSVKSAVILYKTTEEFPGEEKFGLINQIRMAGVSIPSNIVVGCGRNSDKDLIRFLYIALGSLAEVETQLIISEKLNYIDNKTIKNMTNELAEIKKMSLGLIRYLKKKSE